MSTYELISSDRISLSSVELSNRTVRIAKLFFTTPLRIRLYRYLAVYIENGEREVSALSYIYSSISQSNKLGIYHPLAVFCAKAIHNLTQAGTNLPNYLSHWVPADEAIVLASGSSVGLSPKILGKIIDNIQAVDEASRELRKSYLTVIFSALLIYSAFYYLAASFFPMIQAAIPQEITYTGSAAYLRSCSLFFLDYGIPLGIFLCAIPLLVSYSMTRLTGPARLVLDLFFPWSPAKLLTASNFLFSYRTLIEAGLTEQQALIAINRNAAPYLRERMTILIQMNDLSFPDRLAKLPGSWPSAQIIFDLSIYTKSEDPLKGIEVVTRELLDDLVTSLQRMSIVVSNLSMAVFSSFILWIMAATNDIANSVQSTL